MLVTMPTINFFLPTRYIFLQNSFEKHQLMSVQKYNYDEIKEIKLSNEGVLIDRKRRNSFDIIFITDETTRINIVNFLKSKIKTDER